MRKLYALVLCLVGSGCTMVAASPETSPSPEPPPVELEPPPERPPRPAVDPGEPTLGPARRFDEVRALWVVRFTMTSEQAVRDMVERAHRAGINTLIVQVRGRADAFYHSTLEPRAEAVTAPPSFDPLAFAIEEAHRRGIAVHAWVNTHLVWGPTELPESPDHIVNAHPDWLAVPRPLARELALLDPHDRAYVRALIRYAVQRPATVEGVYSSPSHPRVKELVHSVWLDLAERYDLDGIHFDYIRFPSSDFDYSVRALERFRIWALPRLGEEQFFELDARATSDMFAFVDAEPALWAEFRREQITELVERVYRDVKARRPGLVVSAAVVPDAEVAYESRFQDWETWLRDDVLDIVVPMAYTTDQARFEELVRRARAAAGRRERVWAGIGAYLNPADRTVDMIDTARAEDVGGVVLFSYDWVVGEGRGDPEDPYLARIGRARFGGR
jgi:uncharacterized lipoprotein YddW (UPF0748 family)